MLPFPVFLLCQDAAACCQVFCFHTVYRLGCADARCIISIGSFQAISCYFCKQAALRPAVSILSITQQVTVGIIGKFSCCPLHGHSCQLVLPCSAIDKFLYGSAVPFRTAAFCCLITAHFCHVAAYIIFIAKPYLFIWVIFTDQLSLGIIGVDLS